MIPATDSATYSVPATAICKLIGTAPASADTAIDLLWRRGTRISGSDAFPAPTEQKARRLIGLGDIAISRLAEGLAVARPAASQDQRAWSAFIEVVLAQS